MRTRTKLLVAAPVVAVVAVVGGTAAYIAYNDAHTPARLTLASPSGSATPTAVDSSPLDPAGSWTVATGTQVGYRVKETLFGQSTEAVGRTGSVTGGFTMDGLTVSKGSFSVDMATVSSDQGGRDNQFKGRIMQVGQYPTATFTLTQPATVGAVPADQQTVQVPVTGDLQLHGTTRSVTVTLTVQRSGQQLKMQGDVPVHFADYGISNPSGGPASVGDDGTLEVLLVLQKA